jgi:[pyruvate, water dikinase]-phosphate phosphotransferase / [pyruvate, water dikinase] kinase
MTRTARGRVPLLLVSDGTGRTCEQVVTAALVQFPKDAAELLRRPHVRTAAQAMEAVDEAACCGALVFHTLVSPEVRSVFCEALENRAVPSCDLLGPVLTALADRLPGPRSDRPGLPYELHKERFDRIDAVEFTLAHDDGARARDLPKADVVIVGASRVSKSVTCFFLAYRGLRAANVPLVPSSTPPRELLRLDPAKVIGLTMSPQLLRNFRQSRVTAMGMGPLGDYVDLRRIAAELHDAEALMERYHWRSIDVSYRAVEDVASEIAERLGRAGP